MIGDVSITVLKGLFTHDTELLFNMKPYVKLVLSNKAYCTKKSNSKNPILVKFI